MKNKLKYHLLFSFVLIQMYGFSQIDTAFIHHLIENNLKAEHQSYLSSVETTEDSLSYYKAKYYLYYENDSLFFETIRKNSVLFLQDTLALNYASYYFLKIQNQTQRNEWFHLVSPNQSYYSNYFLLIYKSGIQPKECVIESIPSHLLEDWNQLYKASCKKATVAFILSIVPGLGEIYIGNYAQFISKFTALTLFAVQFAESTQKEGLLKPLSIINSGFFSAFYFSSFIGAYRDTKKKKIDTCNQFYIHAATESYSRLPFNLY